MQRTAITILAVVFLCGAVAAQPMGQVQGAVQRPDGNPVPAAMVWLSGVGDGPGHPHRPHFRDMTNPQGQFLFPHVPPGPYMLAAGTPMGGHASELIEVEAGQTTNVTLTLHRRDTTGHNDTLSRVELLGVAMVVHPDSGRPWRTFYFLDVDEDNTPDYRLVFGPPWYNPPSGAQRPQNGDEITIIGGLISYAEPPMVVVFEINGLPWREPRPGEHGGYGGSHPFTYLICNGGEATSNTATQHSPQLVEVQGLAVFDLCMPPRPNPPGVFQFALGSPGNIVYVNLGLDYSGIPGGGIVPVRIVGGLVPPAPDGEPWIIVYEMDGQFVREPGDTTGLVMGSSAADPEPVPLPESHLFAVNYPNPFNAVTTIQYSIPEAGSVELIVYDLLGGEVATLVSGYRRAGTYSVSWNGADAASGVCIYRVRVNGLSFAGRMVLMK